METGIFIIITAAMFNEGTHTNTRCVPNTSVRYCSSPAITTPTHRKQCHLLDDVRKNVVERDRRKCFACCFPKLQRHTQNIEHSLLSHNSSRLTNTLWCNVTRTSLVLSHFKVLSAYLLITFIIICIIIHIKLCCQPVDLVSHRRHVQF